MLYKFRTAHKPICLKLKIQRATAGNVIIVGFDKDRPATEYFFRNMPVTGTMDFKFPCPLSPTTLHVMLFEKDASDDAFSILECKKQELQLEQVFVDKLTRSFVDFATDFCVRAGFMATGVYRDSMNNFNILYQNELKEDGKVVPTPARIDKYNNQLQVSKDYYKRLTIPSRFMILAHEYAHNFMNLDMNNEVEADTWAVKLYRAMGFPVIEGIYAYTQILSDNNLNNQRMENIMALFNS